MKELIESRVANVQTLLAKWGVRKQGNLPERRTPFEQTHRYETYRSILAAIPSDVLQHAGEVVETGMNDSLFYFRDRFGRGTHFTGYTLEREHADAAQKISRRKKTRTDVHMRDIQEGLPKATADVVLDIYSATHYGESTDAVLTILADAVKTGGYIAVVPGVGFINFGDYVRAYPEDMSMRLLFTYKKDMLTGRWSGVIYGDDSKIAKQEVIERLREGGYTLPDNPSDADLQNCMQDMAHVLNVDLVSDMDLLVMSYVNRLRARGFTDVKKMDTADGVGFVGRKDKA